MADEQIADYDERHRSRKAERDIYREDGAGELTSSSNLPVPAATLAGDRRLSGRGNASVRAAAIQQMQQRQGNRATRRSLAAARASTHVQRQGFQYSSPAPQTSPAVPGIYDPLKPNSPPPSAAMQAEMQRELAEIAKWMDDNTGSLKKKLMSGREMLIFYVKSNNAESRKRSNEQVSDLLTEWAKRQKVVIPAISVLGQNRQLFYTLPSPPKHTAPRPGGEEQKGELGKDLREFQVSAELGDIGPDGSKCGVAISALSLEAGVKFDPKPEPPVAEAALSAFTLHLRNHCKELVEGSLGIKGGVGGENKVEGEAEFQVKIHISTKFSVSIGSSIGAEPRKAEGEPDTKKVPLGHVGGAEVSWSPFNVGTLVELKF